MQLGSARIGSVPIHTVFQIAKILVESNRIESKSNRMQSDPKPKRAPQNRITRLVVVVVVVVVFGFDGFLVLTAASLFSGPGAGVSSAETDRLPRRQGWPGPVGLRFRRYVAPGHQPVDFCEDSLKGRVDARGVEGGGFDKGQVVLLRKRHGLVRFYRPQVAQIALVSDEHDHDVGLGVVPQFFQPPLDVLKGPVFGNIVDQEGPDGPPVVGTGDGAVAFLSGRVPDLCLDGLSLRLDGFGGEFDADRRFGFEVEFVSGEPTQEIGFSYTGIPDQDNLEQIIVFFVNSSRHFQMLFGMFV